MGAGMTQRRRTRGHMLDHFWSKVQVGEPDACWEYQGVRAGTGVHAYGRYFLRYDPDVYVYAHIFAYTLTNGEDTRGWVVRHSCDNPPCCNPAHLSLGTQTDNMRDAVKRGRLKMTGLAIGWSLPRVPQPRKPCGTHASYNQGCRCDYCQIGQKLYRKWMHQKHRPKNAGALHESLHTKRNRAMEASE